MGQGLQNLYVLDTNMDLWKKMRETYRPRSKKALYGQKKEDPMALSPQGAKNRYIVNGVSLGIF